MRHLHHLLKAVNRLDSTDIIKGFDESATLNAQWQCILLFDPGYAALFTSCCIQPKAQDLWSGWGAGQEEGFEKALLLGCRLQLHCNFCQIACVNMLKLPAAE